MSGSSVAKVVRKVSPADVGVAAAWERFASGDDVAEGVRPEVMLSWSRCRDEYRVDPGGDRAPLADAALPFSAEENVVAAELGAAAMAITNDVRAIGGVVAVADGNGRILATWGDERTAAVGSRQNLSPLFSWTEAAAGTSGVGMALESRDPIAITRFEHWCAAFHDWSCAAIAVRDPINERPVGVIDISVWNRPLPPTAVGWLKGAVAGVEERLRQRAVQAYGGPRGRVPAVRALRARARRARLGGRIVMADDVARAALGAARKPARAGALVVGHGQVERGWVGSAELADRARVTVRPSAPPTASSGCSCAPQRPAVRSRCRRCARPHRS
jgi:transcriptional regulator of acetoin/glycerol metabolism